MNISAMMGRYVNADGDVLMVEFKGGLVTLVGGTMNSLG